MALTKRGALIIFEGCDRSGKSTQSRLLVDFLKTKGVSVKHMNFPARESNIGQVINSYLSSRQELSDEVIHLMFSANRWEYMNAMRHDLQAGVTLIIDRYSYSGVAYSAAKGLDYNWCFAPERGLVRPDAVFYLKATADELGKRANYGNERYEKLEFQKKVVDVFNRICEQESSYWHTIDANQTESIIHTQIGAKTEQIIEQVANQPLTTLE